MNNSKQEAVTLVTLELLQKTVEYLKRLPVVPVTYDLIRQIESHLECPDVIAAKREAIASELLASRRTGGGYLANGSPAYLVVVDAQTVTFTVPKVLHDPGFEDTRMKELEKGVTLQISQIEGQRKSPVMNDRA